MSRDAVSPVPPGMGVDLSVERRLQAAFHVGPGETVAVLGPNGAGKTTLIHALAGLVPARGSLVLDGVALGGRPAPERDTGVVFQDRMLFPHLTVLQNVAFGPRARGVARRAAESRAREWLERFGIEALADTPVTRLSGGQAQRVALARALVLGPRLLLLDEPLSGLDARTASAVRADLAGHLAERAGITIMSTHDMVDVLAAADRVLVLDGGRVVQFASPAEVTERPGSRHVARMLGLNLIPTTNGRALVFAPGEVRLGRLDSGDDRTLAWHGRILGVAPRGSVLRVRLAVDDTDVEAEIPVTGGVAPITGNSVWIRVGREAVREVAPVAEPDVPAVGAPRYDDRRHDPRSKTRLR